MATVFKASGKDVFGCKAQLKADGFRFLTVDAGGFSGWYGTQESVDKFKARGFRVKVFFQEVDADAVTLAEIGA